jgi:hypothetical protein
VLPLLLELAAHPATGGRKTPVTPTPIFSLFILIGFLIAANEASG